MTDAQIGNLLQVVGILLSFGLGWYIHRYSVKKSEKDKMSELEKEKADLEKEIANLKNEIVIRDTNYPKSNGLVVRKLEDGTEIPICPICTGKNPAFPVPLINSASKIENWICRSCSYIATDNSLPKTPHPLSQFTKSTPFV